MKRLPHFLHTPLVWLFSAARRRIQSGPNAGRFWSASSSGRGYVSGTFERERLAAMESLTRPGDVFWDVGAHQGYVTLAAAKWVGPRGRVVAFEPSSGNRTLLERHVRWNQLDNVEVFPFAISDTDSVALFGGTGGSVSFRLGRGHEMVSTRTVRSLIEIDSHPRPTVLKLDVERNEAAVLRGGIDYLSPDMLVFISLHSRNLYDECRSILSQRGMTLVESAKLREWAKNPDQSWGGDKELLAIGSERTLSAPEREAVSSFSGRELV